MEETKPSAKRKKSNVKHTRAIQHDRSQRVGSAPSEEAIKTQLMDIVHPATLTQVGLFQLLGLRARTLTLPVIVAMVISLIWRQMGSVSELSRVVNREAVLWVPRVKVSMQAINERLRVIPSQLFMNVLMEVLPKLQKRWETRKRPLPAGLDWVRSRYSQVLICDGSTLDAVLRKTGLLIEEAKSPLAGRMVGLLDALSRLPIWIGYTDDETAQDQRFWDAILERVVAGALLIFDLGYTNYQRFAQMTRGGITFVTRAKSNMAYKLAYAIERTATVHDLVVWIGDPGTDSYQQIRLLKVLYEGKWYAYLSNELAPQRLPAHCLVAVYRQRWRIEDAFLITKSLLGLSYFFCGADNAIRLQVWTTWLLYAVLVDVTDRVAAALAKPFADISMEMVYRALPFYVRATHRHETNDLIAFLVSDHKLFGLVKRKRPSHASKKRLQPPLTDLLIP